MTSERRVTSALTGIFGAVLFFALVIFLRDFRPEADGLEQKGPLLLFYHIARLGLAFFVTVFCYTAGYRVLELFRIHPQELFASRRKAFVVCFYFGATLYGIAFSILGLAGAINVQISLGLTIPILLFSYRPIRTLTVGIHRSDIRALLFDSHTNYFFTRALILVSFAAALLFLLTRVVFIAVFDPNIWEHYLHYYRVVLASGSTQPNEVWHHFYASKGAGLILLTNVLGDFFGAQLVSACFVISAGVIILDLLLEYCRSIGWALFGVLLFLLYLAGGVADGATFKHHAVILGYMAFIFWGSLRLQQATQPQTKPLLAILVVALFYLGFYQPVASALLPLTFLLIVLINVALHKKSNKSSFLILACAVATGTAGVLVLNWILTGLLEVTPMRLLWTIADHTKVERVFGTGGIQFFLGMNNDLADKYDWSFSRTWQLLRYPFSKWVTLPILMGTLLVLLVRRRAKETFSSSKELLVLIIAFLVPLSAIAQIVQTAAVDRMALYSIIYTTLATVLMLKLFVDSSVGAWIWHAPAPLRRFVDPSDSGFRVWHGASVVIIFLGVGFAGTYAWLHIGSPLRRIVFNYVTTQNSLKDSMQAVESANPTTGMHIEDMLRFRETMRSDEKILRLAYDAGFSYSLPDAGIVSEPTYALIRDPEIMLTQTPEEVADYLRTKHIGYFTLNLNSKLFTTVVFSALFDPREIPKHFSLAYEDGNFFLLKWRTSPLDAPIPDYLLTMIDLKRTAVLHFPFSKRFSALVVKDNFHPVNDSIGFEKTRAETLKDIDNAFRANVLSMVSLATSKAFLQRILGAGMASIGEVEPQANPTPLLRSILESGEGDPERHWVTRISDQELRKYFLTRFREAILRQYEAEIGPVLSSLSSACDERVPFAIKYPMDARCN